MEKNAQTEGGYAKEMPPEYYEKQKLVIAEHIKKQDVVITTALIPGRPAPILVTEAMVKTMLPGSIIVDLAVGGGGNCELSEYGKTVVRSGVKIIGHANTPSRIAENSSVLFSRNLLNFLIPLVDVDTNKLVIDWDDEIIRGTLICKDGEIVHPDLTD